MGLLGRGATFLNRALGASAGGSLTYARPSASLTATITGWAGQEERDEVTAPSTNSRLTDRERDFLIPVGQAAFGPFGLPKVGDTITETINGESVAFVVSPRDTEPAWRYSDIARSRFRVHTRKGAA